MTSIENIIYESTHASDAEGNSDNTTQGDSCEEGESLGEDKSANEHNLKRSSRTKKPSGYLKDYYHQVNSSQVDNSLISNSCVKTKNHKIIYPISNVLSYNDLSKDHKRYIFAISFVKEPRNYNEAWMSLD